MRGRFRICDLRFAIFLWIALIGAASAEDSRTAWRVWLEPKFMHQPVSAPIPNAQRTEFVAGTSGTRNVLTTYQQDPATGAVTPTYADGRQVYALVPSYQGAVAAYDPNFAYAPNFSGVSASANGTFPNAIAPGQTVTISYFRGQLRAAAE